VYEPLRVATQPLTLLFILLAGTACAGLRQRSRPLWRRLTLALVLLLAAVAHPWAAWATTRALEVQYASITDTTPLPPLRALVVLSGGMMAGARNEGVLSEDSLARTVCGARMAQRVKPEVVVVTGGSVNPATRVSAAERMRDLMVLMGVPTDRILVEGRAQTTVGNARESRALLAPRGITRVGLVTEALHMPRSVGIFRAAGLDPVPLSCHAQAGPSFHVSLSTLLPGPRAAWLFNRAAHEWISLAYYRLLGQWK
jgi:uncharacterized SAM-binding protein YcdF (DUF218 family)